MTVPKVKNLKIKSKYFLILTLLTGCASRQTVIVRPPETREDIAVRGLKITVHRTCEIEFTNKAGKSQNWKMPANGPCFFAKNESGAIEIYKDMRKSHDSMGMILVHSAENSKNKKECVGMNAGILLYKDRVLVQNPPFTTYLLCKDQKGVFDQKHYATSLNAIIYDKNPNILSF